MSIDAATKKRRRVDGSESTIKKVKRQVAPKPSSDAIQRGVSDLETAIAEQNQPVENVSTLLSLVKFEKSSIADDSAVLISLCKVFTRLMASGAIASSKSTPNTLSKALSDCYSKYHEVLRQFLQSGNSEIKATALKLALRMLKGQAEHLGDNVWASSIYSDLIIALFASKTGSEVRQTFSEEYLALYDDCAYGTLECVANYISKPLPEDIIDNVIDVLSALKAPTSTATPNGFFIESSAKATKKGKPIFTPASVRRNASSAWLAVLSSSSLTLAHRKRLLNLLVPTILPWLTRPETLFDFLTSSFAQGGSLSLLSLSGIYHLITTKNLDYPSFYPKLYSLLIPSLMHSKHRSRFFRHLQIFLSSTHLPATLVASFIKRLCRLSLYAPPAAIVATVPYIYNLLKAHPQTTFMIHRTSTSTKYQDPFDELDPNPLTTNAISSSLWELHTLASPSASVLSTSKTSSESLGHYHPNVSSLCQIICLQFTKQQYNTEDFLDHSYASMLNAELNRGEVKKEPVVEWKIPKRILVLDEEEKDGAKDQEGLDIVRQFWSFE